MNADPRGPVALELRKVFGAQSVFTLEGYCRHLQTLAAGPNVVTTPLVTEGDDAAYVLLVTSFSL